MGDLETAVLQELTRSSYEISSLGGGVNVSIYNYGVR